MGDITKNFSRHEFFCKGCESDDCPKGHFSIDLRLVNLLQEVRDHFGRRVTINSAYRCPQHNLKVGGSKNSQHLKGMAADFVVSGVSPGEVQIFLKDHIGGLGSYAAFTHVDTRGYRARWKG